MLPLFVAEMDYPLAEPVQQAVIGRVLASDTGYIAGPEPVAEAFSAFAARTWGWAVEPRDIRCTTDVSVAIVECLRQAVPVDGSVVITPPVYPPFFELPVEADASVVEVPLLAFGSGWELDLPGIERAFARGADALLLCNPHNPLGLTHRPETLKALAELSAKYGVAVISDEIHAPLTYAPDAFTPYLSVSDAAREFGICVTAASKGWNIAGTKCAVMVASSDRTRLQLASMPAESKRGPASWACMPPLRPIRTAARGLPGYWLHWTGTGACWGNCWPGNCPVSGISRRRPAILPGSGSRRPGAPIPRYAHWNRHGSRWNRGCASAGRGPDMHG